MRRSVFSQRRRYAGFTLVEIMVVVCLGVAIMLAVFAAMDSGRNAWLTGQAAVELRQEMLRASIRMESELRATAPAQQSLTAGASSPTLTFRLPRINATTGLVLNTTDRIEWSGTVTYSLNPGGQIIRNAGGANSVLANNITNLTFSRPAANILLVNMTAGKRAYNRRQMQGYGSIQIKMRNQ